MADIPSTAPRSPDGYYWWDGSGWKLLPPELRQSAPAPQPAEAARSHSSTAAPSATPLSRPSIPAVAQPEAPAPVFGRSSRIEESPTTRRGASPRKLRSAVIFSVLGLLFAIFGFIEGATVAAILLVVLSVFEIAIAFQARA